MNKESIIKTTKIIVLIPIGVFVLYFFVSYFANIITIFKLDWYFLIHPSKWFSFDFIWGFPLWETLAVASIWINLYLFLKIIEAMFEKDYSALKKTGSIVLFIILIPILTTVADLGQKFVMKHAFDLEAKRYAVTGIQDKYTTFLLKTMYGVPDERINRLLLENYFAYLTDEEKQIEMANSLTQNLWWQSEYPAFVKAVSSAKNSSLSTSYLTGPDGSSQVKLLLLKEPSEGLVLKIEFPKEAIFSIDPKTGKKLPSEVVTMISIRDHDLDGMPDDFNMQSPGEPVEPVYEDELTEDGFIIFRNIPEHKSILLQWSAVIGFAINHFLHEIDSAMPR